MLFNFIEILKARMNSGNDLKAYGCRAEKNTRIKCIYNDDLRNARWVSRVKRALRILFWEKGYGVENSRQWWTTLENALLPQHEPENLKRPFR